MYKNSSEITQRKDLFRNLVLVAALVGLMAGSTFAQSAKPAISLVKQKASDARLQTLPEREREFVSRMPANFYHFGATSTADIKSPQRLTFEFSVDTQITKISSTPDFTVVPGGTCAAGRYYHAESSCQLLVEFTPKGAGHRLGKLTIAHSASASPAFVPLAGFANVPVVSFVPSLIGTPSETVSGGAGVFNGAKNISIDSGDNLYVADTGNNRIAYIDSSATVKNIATGYAAPFSVTTDTFGEVYFDLPATNQMYEIYDYGPVVQVNGNGTASCTVSSPCNLSSEALGTPGELSTDGYNDIFFVDSHQGSAMATVQPLPAKLIFLYNPFPYQQSPSAAMAVDQSDNLYSLWANGSLCEIVRASLSDAENSVVRFTQIAGGRTCGFSGDGGEAGSAEIGNHVGQIAFDAAGNLYFSDTVNNRVRRVDAYTGIIRTIAGNGTVGNSGDGGAATSAKLDQPSGVAVDSQGQVYITSLSSTTGTAEVIRKVGVIGALTFTSTTQGTTSASMIVNVANTGLNALTITHETITGTNPGDFVIDNTTTSCNFSAGNYLYPGQSCQIGVAFKPGALGSRTATLTLADNTVTGGSKVKLSGTGVASTIVKFTSPTAAQQIPSGTSLSIGVTVTSKTAPAPTGTVTFSVDGKQVGSAVTIASGTASVKSGSLTSGTHTIRAAYSGDQYHHATNSNETITVQATK
jgi:hypothetical protein